MAQHCWICFTVLLLNYVASTISAPTDNEWSPVYIPDQETSETKETEIEPKSLPYESPKEIQQPENTRDIMDKIKRLNDGLTKPKKQQMNYNKNEPVKPFVLDEETLKKLQEIISTGKLQLLNAAPAKQESSPISYDSSNLLRNGAPRALRYTQNTAVAPTAIAYLPIPYTQLSPMPINPSVNEMYGTYAQFPNNDLNTIDPQTTYSTRQRPQLPFQIQWPLAPYFPILIRDPLINFLQGGNVGNIFEYGQNADVCRKQKSNEDNTESDADINNIEDVNNKIKPVIKRSVREGRAIKKRTISHTTPQQQLNTKITKMTKKIFGNKNKLITKKPIQPLYEEEDEVEDPKTPVNQGDLRFPFSDFTWFGNRKPVAPSPGFFINRLKVRRGGVAIAGPGGVATAGRGGTAIVGPGGMAYTQPGGMAVAGPAAKVFALSPETDLNQIISQLQKKTTNDDSGDQLEEDETSESTED